MCIADEVQVGFGRVGSHMWAFELQGKFLLILPWIQLYTRIIRRKYIPFAKKIYTFPEKPRLYSIEQVSQGVKCKRFEQS